MRAPTDTRARRMLYFVSWGCSEGGNKITNDSEQIFYSVLDVLSQGLFTLALLTLTRRLDFDLLGLAFTEYGRIRNRLTGHGNEKHNSAAAGASGANGNGNTYAGNGNTYNGNGNGHSAAYGNGTNGAGNPNVAGYGSNGAYADGAHNPTAARV